MTLYETIYVRKSTRNFKMDGVLEKTLEDIMKFEKEIESLDPEISTKIEIIKDTELKERYKGAMVAKAPYYLAIYSEEKEGYMINAGYIMEQMVLYLSVKGLGSCYQGAVKSKKNNDYPGYKFVILVAFGFPKDMLHREKNTATRLKLNQICTFKSEMGKQLKTILEAARLAPSSMNIQPWRFVVYENRIHVFLKKPSGVFSPFVKWNEFDVGIMLSHIMLAAEELWVDISMKKLENITHKSIPNNQYIKSIVFK